MAVPPRTPPRFVPTLTDVVQMPGGALPAAPKTAQSMAAAPAVRTPAPPKAAVQGTPAAPLSTPPKPAATAAVTLPNGFEEYVVHRVMQRVDVVLDQRLREAIALVVEEQTRSMLPRLREEVEAVVRNAVYEAVAEELGNAH